MSTFAKEINDDQFETQVLHADRPVLVDFWASWCGPCRTLAPLIERIAQEFDGEIDVLKVNVEQNPIYSTQLGVRSIPALFLFHKGEIIKEIVGIPDPKQLVDWLEATLDRD